MIRRALFLATAVVAAFVITVPANPQGMRQSRVGQFWGSWVHWAQFGPGLRFPALVTINVDGTLTVSGDIHGVWERTGLRTVHATSLKQNKNAAGDVVELERHRCVLNYSNDFNSYTGTEFPEVVTCPTPLTCPDPLDPKTKWTPASWAPNGFSVAAERLEVVR